MGIINKWIRIIHRWLAVPLMAALVILIIGTIQQGENYVSPDWLGALGIGSILSLVVTGIYMFVLHYLGKLRRARNSKRVSAPAAD